MKALLVTVDTDDLLSRLTILVLLRWPIVNRFVRPQIDLSFSYSNLLSTKFNEHSLPTQIQFIRATA